MLPVSVFNYLALTAILALSLKQCTMLRQVLRRTPTQHSLPRLSRPPTSTLLSAYRIHLTRTPLPHPRDGGIRTFTRLTTQHSLRIADSLLLRSTTVYLIRQTGHRAFHATPRNDVLPVLPFLTGFLKVRLSTKTLRFLMNQLN